MSDISAPKPGWYADPENPASERWWNGSGWSEQQRPATVAPPAPATPPPPSTASSSTAQLSNPMFPAPLATGAAAESPGFTFGAAAGADGRPDPYAPPPPAPAAPYYTPYTPYGAQPASSVNGLALAGLLTAAIGWFIIPVLAPIAGIVLSIFGLGQATKRGLAGTPNTGRGLAVAGIAVGGIVGVLQVLFYIAIFGSFFFASSSLG